jgi:hypothetical protein
LSGDDTISGQRTREQGGPAVVWTPASRFGTTGVGLLGAWVRDAMVCVDGVGWVG